MVAVAFAAVSKEYADGERALRGLTLDIDPGTVCCLIGPSGCGKSTALRVLAGLEEPTHGEVRLGSRWVTRLPTRQRNLGLVTQQNALIRKRSTERSIALPVELRGAPPEEVRARVLDEARGLDIVGLLHRRADRLSGGEAQLAQIARAVIARPDVLLLDEPLARVDPARRASARADLLRLQRAYGVTTLWVTADQAEAMAVADRLAVLLDGRLEQVGAPLEVHDRPRTVDVARFVGEPEIGLVDAVVRGVPGDLWLDVAGVRCRVRTPAAAGLGDRRLAVGIRPIDVHPASTGRDHDRDAVTVTGRVVRVEPLGHAVHTTLEVPGGTLSTIGPAASHTPGDRHRVDLAPGRFHLFDRHTGVALHHPE